MGTLHLSLYWEQREATIEEFIYEIKQNKLVNPLKPRRTQVSPSTKMSILF